MDRRRRGRGAANPNRSADGAAPAENKQPQVEISDADVLIEFRKLLKDGLPEAQAAKQQFDETRDRAAFTKKAKELVLQHKRAPAAAPAKPAAPAPAPVAEEAATTAVSPASADGASSKPPRKERQQRERKDNKRDEAKSKKSNKKWEPRSAKKGQAQDESAAANDSPTAAAAAAAGAASEAGVQEQPQPVQQAGSDHEDEAAARLQELLSSDSAFSTSFAFSRWRDSVADAPSGRGELGAADADATQDDVDAAAKRLSELSVSAPEQVETEAPTTAARPQGQEQQDGDGERPAAREDAAPSLAEQTRNQGHSFNPMLPQPLFYPPPMHEMGHFPPFLGHMMPPSPTPGSGNVPAQPNDVQQPPADSWNMMGGYPPHALPRPGMSPPPMMPFGMPWDPRMEPRDAHGNDHLPAPDHGPQRHDMPPFMPPHAFMMGPFAGFAMPAPPAFMGMPFGGPFHGMPYPFPGRPPMDGHMQGEPQPEPIDGEAQTQHRTHDGHPEPEITGEAVREAPEQHTPPAELRSPQRPAAEELDDRAQRGVLTPSDAEVAPTGSTLESDTKSLLRLLRVTPPPIAGPMPTVAGERSPAPKPVGNELAAKLEAAATIESKEQPAEAAEKPARAAKHQATRTISKDHPGALSVFVNDRRAQEGMTVRPQTNMTVKWHVGSDIAADPEKHLVIGLHRIGVASNSNHIVTKAVKEHDYFVNDQMGYGEISFRTPRSPGLFVYRLFDADNDTETYATSSFFVVTIAEQDVVSGLRYVQQLFAKSENNISTALIQLQQALRLVRRPIPNAVTRNVLSVCLTVGIDNAESSAVKLHEAAIAFEAVPLEADEHAEAAKQFHETERKITRTHAQVFDVIAAANSNAEVWNLVPADVKQRINDLLNRYCPLLNTLFVSPEELRKARVARLGFIPAMFRRTPAPAAVTATLSRAIDEMLPSLLPSPEFFSRREGVRLRILQALESAGIMPPNSQLTVFGSSANNFGSDNSDLDMCLRHPQGVAAPEDKSKFIEQVAEYLERLGMAEVNCRSTARIPIVLFREPTSGLECDISMYNALAVRNTQLLHTYSRIDPRVRALAYVIKHWARARHINSPPHGTLSSYGYILCLIHFLQTRQPPVLPNLQRLPPDWRGEDLPPNQQVAVPKLTVTHPVDGTQCDTYFYVPTEHNFSTLSVFASRNTQSVGELLMEFFGYYAWQFDYKEYVVSIRSGRKLPKYLKGEYDCWNQNGRLSIEDPFETWYDVAHPVKDRGHRFIRKEFVRAYTQCVKACGWDDGLNDPVQLQSLLAKICEVGELPSFMRNGDEQHDEEESPDAVHDKPTGATGPAATARA